MQLEDKANLGGRIYDKMAIILILMMAYYSILMKRLYIVVCHQALTYHEAIAEYYQSGFRLYLCNMFEVIAVLMLLFTLFGYLYQILYFRRFIPYVFWACVAGFLAELSLLWEGINPWFKVSIFF